MKKKILYILIPILLVVYLVFCFYKMKPEEVENTIVESNIEEILSTTETGEEGLEKEGFLEENPDLISGTSGENEEPFVLGAKQEQAIYFSQTDNRWKNHSYSSIGKASQTIGSSGCGPTSAAMVVSSIKGTIYPDQMGDLYLSHGYRSANDGTYFSAFQWTANYFGIEFKRVWNVNDAIQAVRDNYYVITSCGNGLFTTGGHFIVLYDIEGDTLKIYDPYLYNGKFEYGNRGGKVTLSGNTALCSTYNFINYANSGAWFCFKSEGTPQPDPTPITPDPTPAVETKTGTVKVNSSLNVRKGPGTGYSYIRSLYNGNQVTIYEESNSWYRIGDNEWVISTYITVTGSTPVNPSPSRNTVGNYYKLKTNCPLWSNSDLTGIQYSYLKNTKIKVVKNISDGVDYVYIPVTGRYAYIDIGYYNGGSTSTSRNTVGQYKKLKQNCSLWSQSDLTGTEYNYLKNTRVKIIENVSNQVDKIYVPATGRYAYVNINNY